MSLENLAMRHAQGLVKGVLAEMIPGASSHYKLEDNIESSSSFRIIMLDRRNSSTGFVLRCTLGNRREPQVELHYPSGGSPTIISEITCGSMSEWIENWASREHISLEDE